MKIDINHDKLNSNAKELLAENLNNAKERYNNYIKNLETKEKIKVS